MASEDRIRIMKEDLKNAHNIVCKMGLLIGGNEASEIEVMFWELARGVYDILEEILRKLGEW